MLRLLTDSHVPPGISGAARKLALIEILPIREWHGGIYLHEKDPRLLSLASKEHLTIVTYDVNTFPLHVKERLEAGLSHAGVIYVSRRYRQNQIGAIARGLVQLWLERGKDDWTNRIDFIR